MPSYANGRTSCELYRRASRSELNGKVDFEVGLAELAAERFEKTEFDKAAQFVDNFDRVWKKADMTGRILRSAFNVELLLTLRRVRANTYRRYSFVTPFVKTCEPKNPYQ